MPDAKLHHPQAAKEMWLGLAPLPDASGSPPAVCLKDISYTACFSRDLEAHAL